MALHTFIQGLFCTLLGPQNALHEASFHPFTLWQTDRQGFAPSAGWKLCMVALSFKEHEYKHIKIRKKQNQTNTAQT